jgi:Holliday junction DNA helicase RuvA
VREEALTLYGFTDHGDREAFRILMGVSGVGPKLALTVLSELTAHELALAVARADKRRLEAISGVGKKTAARLLLELKDKLPSVSLADLPAQLLAADSGPSILPPGDAASQVCDALTRLGFSRVQAETAVAKIKPDAQAPVEQLLRQALASLG